MPVGEPVMTTAPLPAVALIAATPCLQARYMPVRFDADDLVPHRLGQGIDLAVALGGEDAGVGDEDIEPAEVLDDLREGGLDFGLVADVGGDRDRFAAGLADVVDGRLGAGSVPVEDRDPAAFLGQPFGGGLADARPGTGDRCHLASQAPHCSSSDRASDFSAAVPQKIISFPRIESRNSVAQCFGVSTCLSTNCNI